MLAAVVAIIILAVVAVMVYQNLTPPSQLGLHQGRLAALASTPNGVSTMAQDSDKSVAPLNFKADLKATQLAALRAFAHMPNNQIIERNERYVHAVFFSPRMGFRDDVELYFDQQNQVLHYRSQSRVGYSDMGVNRQRYQRFAELYAEAP
ncbi:DUF1499 domain-containing protein [Agarivorans gilvus]|jgi:uncharacterized protein (DUF1499 family)|uniref:DUF1499 domain-containing protein n=1 Tax=Agarivorans gilvus TaxID=680279 RepID=A0ABQ1I151_9ALTE|nr:DUF1499 domain-containing protein [Agarivorans gilvus]GGB06553.1 hypothetical protein GCM10007414_19880 [Agarivorans gilvus]